MQYSSRVLICVALCTAIFTLDLPAERKTLRKHSWNKGFDWNGRKVGPGYNAYYYPYSFGNEYYYPYSYNIDYNHYPLIPGSS